MNSKNPPANLPNEDLNKDLERQEPGKEAPLPAQAPGTPDSPIQAPAEGPQSLPQDDDLAIDPSQGLNDPDEKLKRIQREGEINKVAPTPENNIGPDTTGVGQPKVQPVNQGQSLPQSAIPVDNKFDGKTEKFYDPNAAEVANHIKDRALRGGKKTDQ